MSGLGIYPFAVALGGERARQKVLQENRQLESGLSSIQASLIKNKNQEILELKAGDLKAIFLEYAKFQQRGILHTLENVSFQASKGVNVIDVMKRSIQNARRK